MMVGTARSRQVGTGVVSMVLGVFTLSQSAYAGQERYRIYCRGGPSGLDVRYVAAGETKAPHLEFNMTKKGSVAGESGNLGPGECAFKDRAFRNDERQKFVVAVPAIGGIHFKATQATAGSEMTALVDEIGMSDASGTAPERQLLASAYDPKKTLVFELDEAKVAPDKWKATWVQDPTAPTPISIVGAPVNFSLVSACSEPCNPTLAPTAGTVFRGAQPSLEQFRYLRDVAGVRTIVDLKYWSLGTAKGKKLVDEANNDAGKPNLKFVSYSWNPLVTPGDSEIDKLLVILKTTKQTGKAAYVHCLLGRDRTGIIGRTPSRNQ